MPRLSLDAQMTHPKRIRMREREEKALELRLAGAPYRKIAEALGVNVSTAHRDVLRALDRLEKQIEGEAKKVRQMELERLDRLTLALWKDAKAGHLGAIDRLLKIMERRARLLGIDIERHEVKAEHDHKLQVVGFEVVPEGKDRGGSGD